MLFKMLKPLASYKISKFLASYLYKINICKCIGNTSCFICWGAMEDAFDKEYKRLKDDGMEDYLEAKHFMWNFFDKRGKNYE